MRAVVTGAAGFLGSHLCERLVSQGHTVVGVDNLVTGSLDNLAGLRPNGRFSFTTLDVSEGLSVDGPVDAVLHLASPASPPDYLRLPIETLRAGGFGTYHAVTLAQEKGARFLLASTSEVYGDPLVHPQTEDYWGHVNSIGPRSVYDEAKRFAEAMTAAHCRRFGVQTRIVRIFNTYGPRMRPNDGRVVSNFITQALRGEPLTVYGDGSQTRSFCYVDDLITGILLLLEKGGHDPVNLGNPGEYSVRQLAELVLSLTGSASSLVFRPLPTDDPRQRQPDIARAKALLGWEPRITLDEGLRMTIAHFRQIVRG